MSCNKCNCEKSSGTVAGVSIDMETNMISQLAVMMEKANLEPEERERVAQWFWSRYGA